MRTTTVPAQVTTVEDRVAGNLTIPQLLILMAGFGLMTLVYLLVTPKYHVTPFKITLLVVIAASVGPLAIRVADRIVAEWFVILMRYTLRPRRYVFTKSDHTRPLVNERTPELVEYYVTHQTSVNHLALPRSPRVILGDASLEPSVAFRFIPTKKGGLHVALAPTKR